jgi:hypothetical protein
MHTRIAGSSYWFHRILLFSLVAIASYVVKSSVMLKLFLLLIIEFTFSLMLLTFYGDFFKNYLRAST